MLLSEAEWQSSIPAIQPGEHRTRAEIIVRYRRLRAISKTHNNGASKFMSWGAFREQARRLGVMHGKTLVLNTEDELAYVNDLALYAGQAGRRRPSIVTRHRSICPPIPTRRAFSRRCARRASSFCAWSGVIP